MRSMNYTASRPISVSSLFDNRSFRGGLLQTRASGKVVTSAGPPPLPPLNTEYENICTFTDYANWLIPPQEKGAVMLGRYPYVEPARCRSHEKGEEQLRTILEAGVTTFVSLQGELPPQLSMRVGGVEGFLPYRPTATLLAAALSDPPSLEEINALRTPDLDKFLPPRSKKSKPDYSKQRNRITLDFLHFPITDLGLPADQQTFRDLIDDLQQRIVDKGEKIYIHCWGGRGRAGTTGACLLGKMYSLSADEALDRVQRAFDTRRDGGRRSPETASQQTFVKEFIGK